MHGKNPQRPPVIGDGTQLDVQEIFYTLQGEGPFAGYPAVFIRLGGCNLACDFCDTEFESYQPLTISTILETVEALSFNSSGLRIANLAVITGGEPFRQSIELLCEKLIDMGFEVQIETNGTLFRPVHRQTHIICSPKNVGQGYMAIRPDLLRRLSALKFIISCTHPLYQNVSEVGQSEWGIPVYLQPMDEGCLEKNAKNLERVTKLALEHGYRVSLQMHKILGVA